MKISHKSKTNILKKNNHLETIKKILKKEFIGLDEVIDNIIDYTRPFYIFPKSLKRPLIVNLYGMTATGKTHLVERIVDLLELNDKYIRFDVGEYANSSGDWKLRHALTERVGKKNDNNLFFVFDEIQMGRTISERGEEIDRVSLRPMWELIDSGTLGVENEHSRDVDRFTAFLNHIDFNVFFDKDLNTKSESTSYQFSSFLTEVGIIYSLAFQDAKKFSMNSFFETDYCIIKTQYSEFIDKDNFFDADSFRKNNTKYFSINGSSNKAIGISLIPQTLYNKLEKLNRNFFEKYTREKFIEHLKHFKTKEEIIDFIKSICSNDSHTMKKVDFSKSIIFCIGNIDEAYKMSHSSNPDSDADSFYEHSLKITTAHIKEALSERFRMEQIGRLGNNIVIYPSFSMSSYKKIIKKLLNERVEYFKKEFKINLSFTDSLEDIFYKESVFPSQGVRPLLSSMSTFVDSYISKIISDIILKKFNVIDIIWDFDYVKSNHRIILNQNNQSEILVYSVKLNLENLRKSDFSENQSYTAIHESGHALIAMVKSNIVPKLVVSKTASTSEGFCRIEQPDIKTKETELNEIMICLGGRAAEKFILKDEKMLSTGSYSDLKSATEIANKMVKAYGHGKTPFVVRHDPHSQIVSFQSENLLLDSEADAVLIIKNAETEVDKILSDNKVFLLEMVDILSNKSQINEEELKKLCQKYKIETKDKKNYYNIKERILEFKKQNI